MVKLYGFGRQLKDAFDLLKEMEKRDMSPSIIFFTNLIHISFMLRNSRKAELAFKLFKKTGNKGDSLMYSKLIEGLIKLKKQERIGYYLDYVQKEKTGLNLKTINKINSISDEYSEILSHIQEDKNTKVNKKQRNTQFKNNFNEENPKKFKKMIREQKKRDEKDLSTKAHSPKDIKRNKP